MVGYQLEEALETTFQMGFTVSKKLEGRKRLANEIGAVLLHGSKGRQICCSAIGKTDCRPTLESPELLQTNVFTHI